MTRRSFAGLIVAVWIGALSWLGWRELGTASATAADDATRTISPGAAYYVVSVAGTAIGYAAHTVDTVPDGLQIDDRLILELPDQGGVSRTDRRTTANLTNTLRLQDFETTVSADRGGYVLRGSITEDTALSLDVARQGTRSSVQIQIPRATVLPEYAPLRLVFQNQPGVGDTIAVAYLDPTTLAHNTSGFMVVAESTIVFPDSAAWDSLTARWVPARTDTMRAWNIEPLGTGWPGSLWVSDLGQVLSATYESGLRVERTAFEIAFHNFRSRPDSGAALLRDGGIFGTAVAAGILTLEQSPAEFRVLIGGDWPPRDSLTDSRQSFVADTLLIQAAAVDVVDPTLRIPIAGTSSLVRFMRPDGMSGANDPRIQAQARLAIEGTTRANRAAQRITRWVYENLDKRPDVGVPSALQVLEARAGDSFEHALLFVGLARAAGLPARIVGGLLHANGRFYYHNWAEVYLGSGWLAVDPTYGQYPADAAHVRLVYGGRPGDIEMVRLIGNLQVEVVGDGAQETG